MRLIIALNNYCETISESLVMQTLAFSGSQLVNEWFENFYILSPHQSPDFVFPKNTGRQLFWAIKNQLEHLPRSSPRVDFYSKLSFLVYKPESQTLNVRERQTNSNV